MSSDSVDTQEYSGYLKRYPATNKADLNYKSINNNMNVPKKLIRNKWLNDYQKYDYKVHSHVDLSKLFLQPIMTHYSALDGSCDASALLGMVINISSFPTNVRTDAEKVYLLEIKRRFSKQCNELGPVSCYGYQQSLIPFLNSFTNE